VPTPATEHKLDEPEATEEDFDRVMEEKEKETVVPVRKEEKVKRGTMAAPPLPAAGGRKMTRDEILKQLKASRAAGVPLTEPKAEPPASTLSSKFKKIGDAGGKKRWIETDHNGRRKEILVTTDAEGRTKRKVRWLDKPPHEEDGKLLSVDATSKPLGMEVPAEVLARAKAAEKEDEDEDIFQGVGADYDPLADIGEDNSTSESELEEGEQPEPKSAADAAKKADLEAEAETGKGSDGAGPSQRRNYFATGATTEPTEEERSANPLTSDPTILAALKRAAAIRKASPSEDVASDGELDEDASLRRKKFLEEAKKRDMQDSMDLDMGFGGSRFADDEDEEEILPGPGAAGNKRKRGPKKKKGNKDSATDVLKVLEGRRKS
jgi:hypothetical protein